MSSYMPDPIVGASEMPFFICVDVGYQNLGLALWYLDRSYENGMEFKDCATLKATKLLNTPKGRKDTVYRICDKMVQELKAWYNEQAKDGSPDCVGCPELVIENQFKDRNKLIQFYILGFFFGHEIHVMSPKNRPNSGLGRAAEVDVSDLTSKYVDRKKIAGRILTKVGPTLGLKASDVYGRHDVQEAVLMGAELLFEKCHLTYDGKAYTKKKK